MIQLTKNHEILSIFYLCTHMHMHTHLKIHSNVSTFLKEYRLSVWVGVFFLAKCMEGMALCYGNNF